MTILHDILIVMFCIALILTISFLGFGVFYGFKYTINTLREPWLVPFKEDDK